jgi:hypothetical protein
MAFRKKLTPEKVFRDAHQAPRKKAITCREFWNAWCVRPTTFCGVSFFREAISTISMAQISMKPYIIQKEIE